MSGTQTAPRSRAGKKSRNGEPGLHATPVQRNASNNVTAEALPRFLSVRQLAELLHVNEKKVYQLAGEGEIPCTKVTGKWLFPTQLIENWIFENSHGGVMTDRLVVAGSEDMLVQRVSSRAALAMQDSAMISYSPQDTRHGLRMLETGRVDATFINWGATQDNALRHLGLLRNHRNHMNWVVVRVLQRNQGLVYSPSALQTKPDTSLGIPELVRNAELRWALRRETSGSMRLLQDECTANHVSLDQLNTHIRCDGERASVAAISMGLADITCGSESAAREYNLGFIPVTSVNLDLVMMRKTYFRTLLQAYLAAFRHAFTQDDIKLLGGYRLLEDFRLITTE